MAQAALADGYVKLCIDPSLNFFDGKCRVLVSGSYFDDGQGCDVVADTIIQVPNERDIDCQFGPGSQLSSMLKTVFCQCPENVEVFALPRADAANGVKSVYEMTIGGDALTDGRIEIFLANLKYSINVFVEAGDTADDIATLIANDMSPDFFYEVSASGPVVTFTAKNAGTIGNYLNPIINPRGLQDVLPEGVTFDVVRTVDGENNPDPIDITSVVGDCCYDCYALGYDDEPNQRALRDHIRQAWDCDKPQCFGHGYVYNSGTVGQISARGDNSAELSRLAHCTDDPNFPWEKVAAYAALRCCNCDSPELSIQGRQFGVLSCLAMPQSCETCFTFEEQTILRENGFVVTGPISNGSGAYTSPYIYNDVTNYLFDELGRANATFRDTNLRYLAKQTAVEVAEKLEEFNGLGLFTRNTTIRQGVRGTNPRLILAGMRAWAKEQIGVRFSEFDNLDEDLTVQTDFEVAPQCQGDPNRLHLFLRYRPPVRIGQIVTTLQPKILDNCDR